LEFEKDTVIYLSNFGGDIDLPGKEEALCTLHFLLSFAPSPSPVNPDNDEIMFSAYQPSIHRYLPLAVDSLAKLLARGDPNRAFYKTIFAADNAASPTSDLLTRAFGLAIAPVPNGLNLESNLLQARIPFLAQGLLAADILISLIPSNEHGLARSWLTSQDGFAPSLFRMVMFSINPPPGPPPPRHHTTKPVDNDSEGYSMIANRGITILRKLAEKSKDSDRLSGGIPLEALPKKASLIDVMLAAQVNPVMVRNFCNYAGLEA